MKGSDRRERSFDTAESEVVRKNRIFEIQVNLTRRCLFHSEKITALIRCVNANGLSYSQDA
jgi:hypothetical protein